MRYTPGTTAASIGTIVMQLSFVSHSKAAYTYIPIRAIGMAKTIGSGRWEITKRMHAYKYVFFMHRCPDSSRRFAKTGKRAYPTRSYIFMYITCVQSIRVYTYDTFHANRFAGAQHGEMYKRRVQTVVDG